MSDRARTVGGALAASGLDAVDARVLLCDVLCRDHAWIIAHGTDPLPDAAAARFAELVARRRAGEPVAYLTGTREFWGMPFAVSPAVLIPRPETELLVELALERLPAAEPRRVLDLGTGSGCVAIAIAHERRLAAVTAVDCSTGALDLARLNCRALLGDATCVRFLAGDWYAGLAGERFDLIVANPPYIAAGDPHLAQGDLRFEPAAALTDGADGLAAIRTIVAGAPAHLAPGAWLLFEHGYDQGRACRSLLLEAGYTDVLTSRDLAGIERVSGGRARVA